MKLTVALMKAVGRQRRVVCLRLFIKLAVAWTETLIGLFAGKFWRHLLPVHLFKHNLAINEHDSD